MDPADIAALRAAVRGSALARGALAAANATGGASLECGRAAPRQGWFELAATELLGATVTVREELDGIACPVSAVDAALSCTVLEAHADRAHGRDRWWVCTTGGSPGLPG